MELRVQVGPLRSFVHSVLQAAGADDASAEAVTESLVVASIRGVDSHGTFF